MRIANWTQFARICGDPANPDNEPFMEARTSLTRCTATSPTAGRSAGSCASGRRPGAAGQVTLPAAADTSVETLRALAKADGDVSIEISEEPTAGDKADATYKVVVSAGGDKRSTRA